jgi:hypothetical protein
VPAAALRVDALAEALRPHIEESTRALLEQA